MKRAHASAPLLLALVVWMPQVAYGQEVTDFPVCTNFRERYQEGGYDSYGNYIPGFVTTERYNLDCAKAVTGSSGRSRYYRGNPLNPSCNPTRTILTGTLGAGIGAAFNRSARRYTIPIGAALFGLAYTC